MGVGGGLRTTVVIAAVVLSAGCGGGSGHGTGSGGATDAAHRATSSPRNAQAQAPATPDPTAAGGAGTASPTGAPAAGSTSGVAPAPGPPTPGQPAPGQPAPGQPASPSNVILDDEFSGAGVNQSLWRINDGGNHTNGEQQCYQPANVQEGGGVLTETVQQQTIQCPPAGSATSPSQFDHTSGAIQMRSSFTYGTVEVRAKFSGGQGPWPAIWLLGTGCQPWKWNPSSPCNWPQPGSDEIDIAEILGSNHGAVNEWIHSSAGSPNCTTPLSDVSANWHTYKLIWAPGRTSFVIDGATACTLTGSAVPSHPMFLIINLALGGSGGGTIADNSLPQTSSFDYVRVSQGY